MKAGKDALDCIATFEGFRSAPYLDPIGIPTIGYGSTWDANGDRITMDHPDITEDEGRQLMAQELLHVERSIGRLAGVPLTQGQFDGLVSFVYNVGSGSFQRSTMRMKLNRGDYDGAADEFPKWRKAGGRVLPGLVKRRVVEKRIFMQ